MQENTIWENLRDQLYEEAKRQDQSTAEHYYFEQWSHNTTGLLMDALSLDQQDLLQEIAADFQRHTERKLKFFYCQGLYDGIRLLNLLQNPPSN